MHGTLVHQALRSSGHNQQDSEQTLLPDVR